MTVAVETPYSLYNGDGSTTAFAPGFSYASAADIVATVGGAASLWSLIGGNVVFVTAPPVGTGNVLIQRQTARAQLTNFTYNGSFSAPALGIGLDRLMRVSQEIGAAVGQAISVPLGETLPKLPAAAVRAGKYLAFDVVTGAPIALAGSTSAATSAALVSFLQPGTGAVARTVASKLSDFVTITDFGGSTASSDNGAALLAAMNAGNCVIIPPGDWLFSSAFSFTTNKKMSIIGQGSSCTRFIYTGTNTTNDCFTFGNASTGMDQFEIHGIRFLSNTKMTAGAGVKYTGVARATLNDVQYSSQDENNLNFYHGAFFNGCDFIYMDGFQAFSAQDCIRCHGSSLGQADFYAIGGKAANGVVGMHFTGGMGGVTLDLSDVIANTTNILIDQTDTGTNNREFFLGQGLALDSAGGVGVNTGICLDVQDTSSLLFIDQTWIATAGILVRTGASFTGTIVMRAPMLMNAFTNGGASHGNAIEIGNVGARVICNSPVFNVINNFGITCTAGYSTNITMTNPSVVGSVAKLFDPASTTSSFLDAVAGSSGPAISATLAAAGTSDFPYFSGQINIQNLNTGVIACFMCGGTATATFGSTGTLGGTLTYKAGVNGYTFTNTSGASATFSFVPLRQRSFS